MKNLTLAAVAAAMMIAAPFVASTANAGDKGKAKCCCTNCTCKDCKCAKNCGDNCTCKDCGCCKK